MSSRASLERAVVIDASNHIAGRLASKVAKLLLEGRSVVIVRAEEALISGSKGSVVREWLERLEIKSRVHPKHTPQHPRRPCRILTRMVRGMLPRKKPRGIAALKRLRVYDGIPEDYSRATTTRIEEALARRPKAYYVSLGELAQRLGWSGRV